MHNCISFSSDIVLCAGITPVLYIPVLGGYPFEHNVVSCTSVLSSLRCSIAPTTSHEGQKPYVLFIFGLIQMIAIVTTPILVHFITPDQDLAKKSLMEKYPNAPQSILLPQTVILKPIYEEVVTATVIILFIFATSMVTLGTYFALYSFYSLKRQRAILSPKTIALQRSLLLTIITQACGSLGMLGIPTLLFFTSFLISYSNQDLVNALLLIASSHGSVGTPAMLSMNRGYREKLTRCFSRLSCRAGRNVQQKNRSDSRIGWPIQRLPTINIQRQHSSMHYPVVLQMEYLNSEISITLLVVLIL
ncbi:hypothetical protein Aduo_000632 [Ancylostoma duodenale]